MLVMIGADCHMKSHTLVAVDPVGRILGQITVGTHSVGHLRLLTWAEQFDEVVFALEDCRHVTRRLEGDLLRAGQKVLRVPTKLMGEARRIARATVGAILDLHRSLSQPCREAVSWFITWNADWFTT